MGDFCDQGNDLNSWGVTLKHTSQLADHIPIHIAVGNHDTGTHYMKDPTVKKSYPDEGANFDYLLNYRYDTPADEDEITPFRGRYFSFPYGNCFILVLDTQQSKLADPSNPQWEYMERILAGVPKNIWKIAIYHRDLVAAEPLPEGGHRWKYDKFSKYFLPIFAKHGIDLVFQGHAHHYTHIDWTLSPDVPFYPEQPSEIEAKKYEAEPIHLITTGGAGNHLRSNPPITPQDVSLPGFCLQEDSSHFMAVEVREHECIVTARRTDGTVLDEFRLTK